MTTSQNQERRYSSFIIEWNPNDEEYEYVDEVTWNGEPLEFDSYNEFLEFMESLTREEKEYLGLWRLAHNFTGDYITINDGVFDEVSFISLEAARSEEQN
jgi:hypothetical protein